MPEQIVPLSSIPPECRKRHKGVPPSHAKSIDHWEVQGQSIWGKHMKRDGKFITCGHRHKSEKACEKCLKRLRKERPGKCQTYRIAHVEGFCVVYKLGRNDA